MNKLCLVLVLLCIQLPIAAQEKSPNLNHSFIAFTIPEKDLLPENITYDSKTESFFIGSTRKGKIIKIDKNKNLIEFANSKSSGLWMVIGMKADVDNRWLWVCSSGGDNLIGYDLKDDVEGRPSGIFKFNLDTGELIKKYVLDATGEIHFFNDLVIDGLGNLYVTHMFKEHAIYTIQKNIDQLKSWSSPEALKYPNGITISSDNKTLFIAYSEGIGTIDIASKKWGTLKNPNGIRIARRESIDGLYFYNNTLIAVHPDINTVQQLRLSTDQTTITDHKLLEVNHPMMNNPTTGVMVKDNFYYIANAQFGSFDENGAIFPMEQLYEPTILKLQIDE